MAHFRPNIARAFFEDSPIPSQIKHACGVAFWRSVARALTVMKCPHKIKARQPHMTLRVPP